MHLLNIVEGGKNRRKLLCSLTVFIEVYIHIINSTQLNFQLHKFNIKISSWNHHYSQNHEHLRHHKKFLHLSLSSIPPQPNPSTDLLSVARDSSTFSRLLNEWNQTECTFFCQAASKHLIFWRFIYIVTCISDRGNHSSHPIHFVSKKISLLHCLRSRKPLFYIFNFIICLFHNKSINPALVLSSCQEQESPSRVLQEKGLLLRLIYPFLGFETFLPNIVFLYLASVLQWPNDIRQHQSTLRGHQKVATQDLCFTKLVLRWMLV